jgi:hypothetical protein
MVEPATAILLFRVAQSRHFIHDDLSAIDALRSPPPSLRDGLRVTDGAVGL